MSKSDAILNIGEKAVFDDSITEYEVQEYLSISGTHLNITGDIRITIESQDIFTHISESYLLISGRLTKANGTAYANADVVALTNKGIIHLFDSIRFDLGGQEIETLRYPGQSMTMLKAVTVSDDYARTEGLNSLWYKDTTTDADLDNNSGFNARHSWLIVSPDPKGYFEIQIPLKEIFGFCEDCTKIFYGLKQQLTLKRKGNNDAIFGAGAADAGTVTLEKISWMVPHVTPADDEKFSLMKQIQDKTEVTVDYRMRQADTLAVPQSTSFDLRLSVKTGSEKPRYVIVAFQTGKDNDQEQNPPSTSMFRA